MKIDLERDGFGAERVEGVFLALRHFHRFGHGSGIAEVSTVKGVVGLRPSGYHQKDIFRPLAGAHPVAVSDEALLIVDDRCLLWELLEGHFGVLE
jgi:hypothetical protein